MDNADQVDSTGQGEVEEENFFEAFCHRETAHPLEFGPGNQDGVTTFRLTSQDNRSGLGRCKETFGDLDTGVFGVPNPLGDKVTLCGFA